MAENIKKLYLITAKNRKPYHLQNLKARYKSQIVFTDTMETADMVLAIGIDKDNEELLKAQELGIKISYFTEELLPDRTLDKALEKENQMHVLKDEIAFPGEEL